jgi:hypothetical protein
MESAKMDVITWDGKTISEPGIYAGIPLATYHEKKDLCDGPSISSSGLRTIISKSPAHYWLTSPYNPERKPDKPTDAMILGRAAHHLFLGETGFTKQFAMRPPAFPDWKTVASREWRAQQEKAGLVVLTPQDGEVITGMARSLKADPLIKAGLLASHVERSLIWKDPRTGIWLKARPDTIPEEQPFDFADLKTAASVLDEDLERAVGEYRYDMQAAIVGMGARELFGIVDASFALCFIEKSPPHCISIKQIKESVIRDAELDVAVGLAVFKKCLATNNWFGPAGMKGDFAYIEPKPWQTKAQEVRRIQLKQEVSQ